MSSVFVPSTADPADVFATVYDRWAAVADVNHVDEWREAHQVRIEDLADEVAGAGAVPGWDVTATTSVIDDYVTLAAIDRALEVCHPRRGGGVSAPLLPLLTRLVVTGTLTTSAVDGAVLPRWSLPARPGAATDRLVDAFHSVVRVQQGAWARIRSTRPAFSQDLSPSVGTVLNPLRIAFAPLMTEIDDVRIESGVGLPGLPGASWYRLGPMADRLRPRLDGLLECLDASGAQIAILPEGALDEGLLADWKLVLRSRKRPAASPLRWVLLGSGPAEVRGESRPANRAHMVHRDTGDVLLSHDKFAAFNFGEEQLARWGLDTLIGAPPPVHEAMHRGLFANILESRAGRVAILICEDVVRSGEPVADAVSEVGPSLILTPVFGRHVRRYFWEEQASRRYATLFGSAVAVVNSQVVPAAERLAHGTVDDYAFGLLALPDHDNPDPADVSVAVAAGAEPCVVLPPAI